MKEKNDYYIYKDEKINLNYKNNYEINNIIEEKEILKEKEIIYNKYKDVTDFSKLFSTRSRINIPQQTPPVSVTQIQPQITPPTPASPQTRQTTSQITQPTPTSPQGKTYDASQMWSPISSAGVIYEWNRGVITISQDGMLTKEKLDGTFNHHADATIRCLESIGIAIQSTNAPFQAGIDGANEGAIVFQSEGDNGLVYFPPSISEEQLNELTSIIVPRNGFNFSYTYGEEIFEDQDFQSVLEYATNLRQVAHVHR